jgi:hypothetical protein
MIDSTETSPTFSTNPIRREGEVHRKRPEFQAYLVEKDDNQAAWRAVLGREISLEDVQDADSFLLSYNADGVNSYRNRPAGKGNFVIGVAKVRESQQIPKELLQALEEVKQQGGEIGLILLCTGTLSGRQAKELSTVQETLCVIENVPCDPIGLIDTVILKQTLNLISNGSMILMNKILGNQMIDVRASNNKLIDRCIRLIKRIWNEYQHSAAPRDKELYYYVAHVSTMKNLYEEQNVYTPSVVKIVLAMLSLKKNPENFQEIVDFLREKQERIDWIGKEGSGYPPST